MPDFLKLSVLEVIKRVSKLATSRDEVKEGILDEALVCRYWGVQRDRVIILGWLGRVLIKVTSPQKIMVSFIPGEWNPDDYANWEWNYHYVEFWSSQEQLKFLSDYLKERMNLKVPFELIYNGEL